MAWPHEGTDWGPILAEAEETFSRIISAITRFEELILITPGEPERILERLERDGADTSRVRAFVVPTDDTWTRDYGPITVEEPDRTIPLDFGFNGWGLKFRAFHDNQATRRLNRQGLFSHPVETIGAILEGGSLESDGRGTIMTTTACLLHPNRNPHLTKGRVELMLKELLGAERVLWLSHGHLEGDDTDAHIDTLARFVDPETICHVECTDPVDPHYETLAAMRRELESFRTWEGSPYSLLGLPLPSPILDDEGSRLPATYANFLILNHAVLVPTYGDRMDETALDRISTLFPDRSVVGIDCRTLIRQHGSLHCVTMQFPRGTIS